MLWRDFLRRIGSGSGINGVASALKRHVDDTTVTEVGAVSTDANGMMTFSMSGSPGPVYHTETESGQTKTRSSKAFGTLFPAEVPYLLELLPDGVVDGVDNELEVFADSSGMQVKVRTGRALGRGHVYRGLAEQTVAIGAADATNPRIDRVVARLTRPGQTEEGKFVLAVIAGTPAASPAAPAITQSAATWDVQLAQVRVDAGVVTIAAGKVTDERTQIGQAVVFGGTDLPVADGGTGASTAAAARTNLGLAIGTNVQAYDADLDTWATKAPPAGVAVGTTDAQTLTNKTLTSPTVNGGTITGITDLAVADGGTGASTAGAARTNLGLAIGTDVQAFNATLAAIAGSGAGHLGDYLVLDAQNQASSDTASTTDTVAYSVAITRTITLGTGTWTIFAIGSLKPRHSATDVVNVKLVIDGTDAGTVTNNRYGPNLEDGYSTLVAGSKAGVASGARTITVQFKCGGAGTATPTNPSLFIAAIRTA